MEGFIIWVVVVLIWVVLKSLFQGGGGGGVNMQPFEIRIREGVLFEEEGRGPKTFHLEGRGLFPVDVAVNGAFVTSVLDITERQIPKPVISMVDNFQEPTSVAYCHRIEIGELLPG